MLIIRSLSRRFNPCNHAEETFCTIVAPGADGMHLRLHGTTDVAGSVKRSVADELQTQIHVPS
jgi:hypothetical protein